MVKQEDADRLAEKPLTREEIYTGQILHVVKDTVALPNGRAATREMALHRGAVAVVALDDEGNVVLEKQYRYPMGAVLEEIPAGKLEAGEDDPLGAAKRELREETGLVAETWRSLGIYYPSPAILTEKSTFFWPGDCAREKINRMKMSFWLYTGRSCPTQWNGCCPARSRTVRPSAHC